MHYIDLYATSFAGNTAMTWIVPPIVDPVAIGIAAALYAMLSGA
jgi:hypothetical protein